MVVSGKADRISLDWPKHPYKGLTSYDRLDYPLFAGRNADVQRVARLLGADSTRVLFLHGNTGCGKSSLLKAGLVPFLEGEVGAFRFAREPQDFESTLFIRSGSSPLSMLSDRVFRVAARELEEAGKGLASLSRYSGASEFVEDVFEDPETLVNVLGELPLVDHRTLVLIVDQFEEVVTLDAGAGGDARERFFAFLASLTHTALDLKLIIAFRTEYHGRLYTLLRNGGADPGRVADYYLGELGHAALIDAIEQPTSPDEIPGYGIPRSHYKFYYQKGLAKKIAEDLRRAQPSGGVLPVLQIVCQQLHLQAKDKAQAEKAKKAKKAKKGKKEPSAEDPTQIRTKDYLELGRIEGQIDRHLQQALNDCFPGADWGYPRAVRKTMRWRRILHKLARPHADGSVTTDLKRKDELVKEAGKALSMVSSSVAEKEIEETLDHLTKQEILKLEPVKLSGTDQVVDGFSLAHDSLALALENWDQTRRKAKMALTGLRTTLVGYAVILLGVVWGYFDSTPIRALSVGILSMSVAIALIPDNKFFRRLYNATWGTFLDFQLARSIEKIR